MNVVFDIGNVLLSFEPKMFLEAAFNSQDTAEILMETIFASNEWRLLDQNVITADEAAEKFTSVHPQLKSEIQFVMKNWLKMLSPIDSTVDMLKQISKKHGTYYLSNMPVQALDYIDREFDFWDLFKGGIFSCDIKMIKPNPDIFDYFLKEYKLNPADCIFIDDSAANIKTAESFGIDGVLADSPRTVSKVLEKYL